LLLLLTNTFTLPPQITSYEKENKVYKYKKNALSYKWGRYDIPVDATWGTVDFVHGLCYGTFKNHVNSHHLYQQAAERLFTREIIYRW